MMKGRMLCSILALAMLTACTSVTDNSAEIIYKESQNTTTKHTTSSTETTTTQTTTTSVKQAEKRLIKPQFTLDVLSENSYKITIDTSLENTDKITAYRLISQNGTVQRDKLCEVESIAQFDVDVHNVISTDSYKNDVGALKCDYYASGIILEISNENQSVLSDVLYTEVTLETGVVNQYNATLAGATSCGAAAGMLIIQAISPVWDSELIQRLNTIRNYSALSDDYSIGGPEYYLCGWQITNSVNKFLSDNGITDFSLNDFRGVKTTENTLLELVSTGRPAVLEVCYGNGNVLTDYAGYSHWICINGFRLTKDGTQFRYEDTISLSQSWISADKLDTSNANVSYGNSGFTPTKYISSIRQTVTESFFKEI